MDEAVWGITQWVMEIFHTFRPGAVFHLFRQRILKRGKPRVYSLLSKDLFCHLFLARILINMGE
ncbi:hypothetical protein DXB27_13200 [Parabacteroides gordonii]|nr:hypothetical protein DXB27_13200 [Parabacteroides gordonii]